MSSCRIHKWTNKGTIWGIVTKHPSGLPVLRYGHCPLVIYNKHEKHLIRLRHGHTREGS